MKKSKKIVLIVLAVLLVLLIVPFAAFQVFIGVHSRTQVTGQPQVMVIFGCQVTPDGPSILLRDRLDTALDYLNTHPDTLVVVSGGKGDDEHQSEAQCMHDYLRAHGFEGEVLLEDRSTTTWENACFTRALLESRGMTPNSVLLVSNGFHLGRIKVLWGRAWDTPMTLSTLAAPVSDAPSVVKMFFREPLALTKDLFFTGR